MTAALTFATLLASLAASSGAAPAPQEQKKLLTFEQVIGPQRVSFDGQPPRISFATDGVHLEMQEDGKTSWVHPLTKERREPAPAPGREEARRAELEKALAALPGFDEATAKRVAGARPDRSADGACVLLEADDDLFFAREGTGAALRLTFTPEAEENVRLSPDGSFASFVRGNDLFLIETASGRERAVTRDGGPERLNGKLDWVYQEEVYGRGSFQATWWSPSSRHLAFLTLAQDGVPHFPIVDHRPDRAELEDTRYPKAGAPNPTVELQVVRPRDGRVVRVDLSKYQGVEPLVVRVGFDPPGKRVIFQVQDREQTWLDLNEADPDSGRMKTLFPETTATWVNVLEEPRWLADGSFLWESERTGYRHVYRFDADGKPLAEVTSGDWEVRSIEAVDEAKGLLWFSASRDGAAGSNTYRVALDGSGLARVTQGPGSHSVEWNGDKSLFLDRVSSVAFPTEIRLCDGADGRVLEVLGRAEVKALDEYVFSATKLLEIPARDGFLMDAALVEPAGIEPGRRYPIWLPTYSGPDAPSVRDRWNGDPWTQFLAQQGYAVLQVNNRTSSRKGHAFVSKCWQQLGVQELADLEDALDWIGANVPWADVSRVGITGWSYGGFMTAFALTHGTKFKLGVAGAGVYDWRLYDTIYTERYMRTPRNNPDGYARTSCIEAAKDLSGYLVMAHGTLDDNVHFQNAIQFAGALQAAGKDFEMMAYPGSRHGLGSAEQNRHFRALTWKAIRERL
jgi:dipeptidyl-peptidase-4